MISQEQKKEIEKFSNSLDFYNVLLSSKKFIVKNSFNKIKFSHIPSGFSFVFHKGFPKYGIYIMNVEFLDKEMSIEESLCLAPDDIRNIIIYNLDKIK